VREVLLVLPVLDDVDVIFEGHGFVHSCKSF
jgi:hypothetical protein